MGEVIWTTESLETLEGICRYIAERHPPAAARFRAEVIERAELLASFPELGHRHHASSRNVRLLVYGRYYIAYLARDDGNVEILGVYHGGTNIDRRLR